MSKRKREDVDSVKLALEPRKTTTFDTLVANAPETWEPTTDFAELMQCLGRAQPKLVTNHVKHEKDSIEVCTRAYEENFLVEPNAQLLERPCINGEQCESMHMGGFVLREFLLPSQLQAAQSSEVPQRTCLMCARLDILRLHLQNNTRVAYGESLINVLYQEHHNLVDVKGEYLSEDCVIPDGNRSYTGLIGPAVMHCRSAYEMRKHDGLRGWRQIGYAKSTGNACRDKELVNHFLWRRGALNNHRQSSPE